MTSRAPAILDILGSQGVEALIQSLRAINNDSSCLGSTLCRRLRHILPLFMSSLIFQPWCPFYR